MMTYPYTVVYLDKIDCLTYAHIEAHSGPMAEDIAQIVFENHQHAIFLGHNLCLNNAVKKQDPPEFIETCVMLYRKFSKAHREAEESGNENLAVIASEKSRKLYHYISSMGYLVRLDSASVPPLLEQALKAASGLNDLPG